MANPFESEMQYPDYAAIQRKRKMADYLLKQGGSPLEGQMVSGHYVSPGIAGALAKALMIYKGGQIGTEADTQTKAIAEQLKSNKEAWLGDMPKATDNTSMAGPAIPNKPTAEDYMAWALKGQSIDPQAAQMGMTSANMALTREGQAEARAQAQQSREAQLAQQRQLAEEQNQLRRDLARQQQGQNSYFQALPSEQGYMKFNARTGQMEPLAVGGKAVLPAAQSPALQGQIVTAKESAEADVKTGTEAKKAVSKSDVMLGQINQAENLLKKGPTGSGVGSLLDSAGRLVGVTNEGAKLASQLKSVSGWLVANVPRMEGPQSNFDVQNYQTMAGMVGDDTRPVAERLAALDEIKKLQTKYKEFNQEKIGKGATGNFGEQKAAPKRIRFDAQGNMIQ